MKKVLSIVLGCLVMISGFAVAEETPFISIADNDEDAVAVIKKMDELGYLSISSWNDEAVEALKLIQAALGIEPTGKIETKEELERISTYEAPLNLVWDGCFEDIENRWSKWGNPTLVESVEIDGKTWMHLISSGEHWEGYKQGMQERSGIIAPELLEGQRYTLTFKAYGVGDSVGKEFNCGFHNRSLEDSSIQEQYWTSHLTLSAEPMEYELTFQPKKDGWFQIMIGTGIEGSIEAYYTDVRLVKGR